MKKDGHSHTEFCPHGSGDDVELMIQKAIQFGFTEYSITEHAPLPPAFEQDYAGARMGLTEASMTLSDLPAYFKKGRHLQAKYRDQIKINLGFELDFLPTQLAWTRDFWAEYGPQTQDNVLSVHFMQGTASKFWCVDDTAADFKTGLLDFQHGAAQTLYGQYLRALLVAVQTDLGPNAPHRLGHMTLIKKFQDYFNLPTEFNTANLALVDQLFASLKQRQFSLDLNTAGLYKPYCNETYPYSDLILRAQATGVPLIYGSDAHSIVEVGHGYHQIEKFV